MTPGPRPSARTDGDARSDEELWRSAQAGSPDAFGLLFDRYADVVHRYAMVRLRRTDWAEDVVSTVFTEAWRQRERIDLHDGSLRPWLLGVARNQANRLWSQQSRRELEERRDPARPVDDHADAVARRADAGAELHQVLDALATLPDGPREVLVLHVWGELSHDQIAAELGISTGTVKSRLNRARHRLSATLGRRAARHVPDVVPMFGDERRAAAP